MCVGGCRYALTDFGRARELFATDEGLSFGDATIVVYRRDRRSVSGVDTEAVHVERVDVDRLDSFDADFDAVESVSRLARPTNPFE